MSAEFDDVLTNQPVVIDNVRLFHNASVSLNLTHLPYLGLWNNQGWFCWTRPSQMLLSVFVRLDG